MTSAPKQQDFYMKQCAASPVFQINAEEMRDLDDMSTNEFYLETLNNNLAAARKTFNKQLIAYFIANMGRFPDGSTSKVVSLFDVEKKTLDPFGNALITNEFSEANLGAPIVIGGSHVNFVKSLQPLAGQNQDGIFTGGGSYDNYVYDKMVNEAFGGGEHLIAFDPQMLKLVTYNKNQGRWATDLGGLTSTDIQAFFRQGIGNNIYHGTILDPQLNLLWDLDIVFKDCPDRWVFQFRLNWDVFIMPDSVCNDPSVNGIFHFTGCNMKPTVCPDVGTAPAAPTKQTVTIPGLAAEFPTYVATVQIGKQMFTVNQQVDTLSDFATIINDLTPYIFTVSGDGLSYEAYDNLIFLVNEDYH